MKNATSLLAPLLLSAPTLLHADTFTALTEHVRTAADLGELRDAHAVCDGTVLKLASSAAERHAWAVIPAPKDGWKLTTRATVTAKITNTSTVPAGVMLWLVGDHGWSAVEDSATLAPRGGRTF